MILLLSILLVLLLIFFAVKKPFSIPNMIFFMVIWYFTLACLIRGLDDEGLLLTNSGRQYFFYIAYPLGIVLYYLNTHQSKRKPESNDSE